MAALRQQREIVDAVPCRIARGRDATRPDPLLRAEGINRRLTAVVSGHPDISLSVGPGEIVAIIGPNGAGKEHAAQALVGILRSPKDGSCCRPGVTNKRPEELARRASATCHRCRTSFEP